MDISIIVFKIKDRKFKFRSGKNIVNTSFSFPTLVIYMQFFALSNIAQKYTYFTLSKHVHKATLNN